MAEDQRKFVIMPEKDDTTKRLDVSRLGRGFVFVYIEPAPPARGEEPEVRSYHLVDDRSPRVNASNWVTCCGIDVGLGVPTAETVDSGLICLDCDKAFTTGRKTDAKEAIADQKAAVADQKAANAGAVFDDKAEARAIAESEKESTE